MNLSKAIQANLRSGGVIPAHPLAVTDQRKLDERRQRALTRYYLTSGASGVAVGVHTTQFQIRDPQIDLLKPVLQLASETVDEFEERHPEKSIIRIAGICGRTDQAIREAKLAAELGYHLGLLSLSAFRDDTIDQMIRHAKAVGEIIPLMGFYLQPSVGGQLLGFDFWSRFCEIPGVCAIKIAPFNRYQTLDVIRAVAETGRAGDIALYTGNDDNIVADLMTVFQYQVAGQPVHLRFAGGLLGHWAVWTRRVVLDFERIARCSRSDGPIPAELLTLGAQITDCNAAFFDPPNRFAGCIAGLHEVLRRQGLMQNRLCLDPNEDLSPGQLEEIDRVYAAHPHLNDDVFVAEHLAEWLA
ncbi:MAG: dihydrodipicolinate synthase family protein [Candidatus Omnitrophica bacterium]|nr:dihydrodipicolinate synthase family protein [Candidatus Omnitrophota bacterium]